ncbi:MAG: hypothetical protein ACTSUS_02650 [Candidatus Freyarchaeota archaeon]
MESNYRVYARPSLKEYLQKRHAIDVLLAMLPSKTEAYVGWKAIKERLRRQGIIISDVTYRARVKELVQLGLARAKFRDPIKRDYLLTPRGTEVALSVQAFLKTLELVKAPVWTNGSSVEEVPKLEGKFSHMRVQ